jgi:hypothetical protein
LPAVDHVACGRRHSRLRLLRLVITAGGGQAGLAVRS